MKVGIYNRHWNALGGGENYLGVMAQSLATRGSVDLICQEPFSVAMLESRLNLDLSRCRPLVVPGATDPDLERLSADYDLWVNGTFVSTVRSRAHRSIRVVFFPFLLFPLSQLWSVVPARLPRWLARLLWKRYGCWESYDTLLAISQYTREWTARWWHAPSEILYPPVDEVPCPKPGQKRRVILAVGRFTAIGHNKKQHVMVEVFRQMCDAGLCPGWELHLCGATLPERVHQEYLAAVTERAAGYPVFVHPDMGRAELERLYCEASIFWHATGFGEDERRRPELFEHFGITTVEAMSAGCIPVVIDRAGQKEIVTHGVNGYLWNDLGELKRYTRLVMESPDLDPLRTRAAEAAHGFCREEFSERLMEILTRRGLV
jgi:glycosyltransferase involved in cell wall biosynthesis